MRFLLQAERFFEVHLELPALALGIALCGVPGSWLSYGFRDCAPGAHLQLPAVFEKSARRDLICFSGRSQFFLELAAGS